jgi:putative FmdB family regulatory protein
MPIYEYRCEQGHTFEVMQRMTDDPISVCSTCDAPVERVFHFKGSGFYTTDYGRKRAGDSDSSKDSKPDSSKQSESKADSKSESKAAASSSSD